MSKESSIYQTETKRVKGGKKDLLEAIKEAKYYGEIPGKRILSLSGEELAEKMRYWRIWMVAEISLSKEVWTGGKAAEYLSEAVKVFKNYYEHPRVKKEAQTLKTDPKGHEYQMAAEMARDKGKYWWRYGQLTGYKLSLDFAVWEFERAVSLAEKGTSAWALASMEKEMVKRKISGEFDFKRFQENYKVVVSLAPQAGGYDRMAVVSWWYTKEALRQVDLKEVKRGIESLQKACKELGFNWWKRYPLADLIFLPKALVQRVTLFPKV